MGLGTLDVDGQIMDKGILLVGAAKHLPQLASLLKVGVGGLPVERGSSTVPLLAEGVGRVQVLTIGHRGERRGIVGFSTVVAINRHRTVADEWIVRNGATIDRDLVKVSTQAMTVSIGVGEKTRLQNRVSRGLDTGDGVGGRESSLLDVSKVIVRVTVKNKTTKATKRELGLGPGLGQVEDAEVLLAGLLGAHHLDVAGPRGELAALNGSEKVLLGMVRVLTRHFSGLLIVQSLDALVSLHVDLNIVKGAVLLHPFVGVAGIAMHVAEVSGGATVRKQHHQLVDGLLILHKVVPEHVRVLEVGLRVALLGVNEKRELGRVADEENRGVVVDPVDIALLGVELSCKATRITSSVRGTHLTTDGGETSKSTGLLADAIEESGLGEVGDIVSDLKVPKGTRSLGVDNSLGNTLTIKVREQVNQVVVLKEKRPRSANLLRGIRVEHRAAIGGRVGSRVHFRDYTTC